MKSKKQEKSRIILNNSFYLIRLIFQFSPKLFAATMIAAITEFCVSFLNLFYTKRLVQDITEENTFESILLLMVLWCLVYLVLRFVMISIDNYFRPVYTKVLMKGLEKHLYDKAAAVDLQCYDDSKYYNEYIWTTSNCSEMVTDASNSMGAFLGYVLQISGIVSVVLIIDPSLALLTFVSVVLTLIVSSYLERQKVTYRKECMEDEKRKRYIERVFYLKDSAKDLRLTKVQHKLMNNYEKAYDGLLHTMKKYVHKITIISFASTFGFRYVVNTFLIYGFFAYKLLVLKSINLSDFVVINKAMVDLYVSLNRWSNQINNLYKNAVYVETMKKFLNNEPRIVSCKEAKKVNLEEQYEIEFKEVTFIYPEEEKPVLNHVSFKIDANQTLAIVGYNGAGKTTLIKLLLRLYEVSEGEILLNGINIKDYDLEEYRNIFSAVFQDFQLYAATLGENIMMGEAGPEKNKLILDSIRFANFRKRYDALENGLDTQLTREFDEKGVLLSGGEMQKIAIARVFAGNGRVFILDEPSAALDPVTEYEINNNIMKVSKQHTIILISHRLTATRMADNIIMLENGSIIEQGTHKELLKQDGKYAYMYKLQAEPYRSTIELK